MRRISSHLLSTPQGLLPNRVVSVSDNGTITGISEVSCLDAQAGVEFYPGVMIPSLVNAHCHLELSHLRGTIPSGRGFTAFVRGMKSAVREDVHGAAEFWDARMWSEGVAAAADICNGTGTFELKHRSRICYHSFIEIFGAGADPELAFALRDKATAMGLDASVTPHSLYSLSSENFAAVAGNADCENSPLSIHFMESDVEVPSPAETLVARVPAYRPVVLVHNCLVTQRDIDIVMGHFTAPVTWVLCPGSNRYISGLVPPVGLLRKNGLRIAVGTDSLASNDTLSVIKELALLAPLTEAPLEEMLGWVSADSLEVGHSPGLVNLTGVDMQTRRLTESACTQRII